MALSSVSRTLSFINRQAQRCARRIAPSVLPIMFSCQLPVQVEREGAEGRHGCGEPVFGEEATCVARRRGEEARRGFNDVDGGWVVRRFGEIVGGCGADDAAADYDGSHEKRRCE